MKREYIEKLLGGYATGTLTEEERRALFDAALTDQALFDSLAGEEALREVLEDPRCRRQIEQALRDEQPGLLGRVAGWVRRPTAWALAGSLAATAAIALLVVRTNQQPRPEIHLAQQRKVEAPAPAPAPAAPPASVQPERRMASKPSAPQQRSAPEKKKEAAPGGVVGGVAGGVVGGVMPSQSPAPPAEPPVLAESRAPVAPPPPPAKTAESQPLPQPPAPERQSKDVASVSAMGPVQFAEKPGTRPLSASVRQDAPAPSLQQVRYDVLLKNPNGQFVQADPRTPVAPGVPVRLVLMPSQPGSLSVYGTARNLLFRTNAFAGASYTVDAPPADRKFTVVLAPVSDAAKTSAPTALRQSVQQGKLPGGRLITVIDLTRPRN